MDELDQKDHALDSLVIRNNTFKMLGAREFVHSQDVSMDF